MMRESPEKKLPYPEDADMEGVTATFMRAARRAQLTAHRRGAGVVVMRDGEVVGIEPDPETYEEVRKEADQSCFQTSHFFQVERYKRGGDRVKHDSLLDLTPLGCSIPSNLGAVSIA